MLPIWQNQNFVDDPVQTYEQSSGFRDDLHADNMLVQPTRKKPWLLCHLPLLRMRLIYSKNMHERAIGLQLESLHDSRVYGYYNQEIFEIVAYEFGNSILTKLDQGLISVDAMLIAMDDVAVQCVHSSKMASNFDEVPRARLESRRSGWDLLNDGVKRIGDAVKQLSFSY
jgi:hypothetical protein